MCEFKHKLDCTTAGKVVTGHVELSKRTEYYEKALELSSFGKFNYLLIFISGLILANVLLETLAISFVLPVSQCDIKLTIQERGIMSAIGFAGIIVSSHLWGFLADTKGRRKIIRPTLFAGFVITVLSSFSNGFWILVILRFLNGFCISGGSATIYAYLGEFHTQKNRSRAIMGAAFIFGLGAMLMPAIAWLFINQEWRFAIPFLGITYKPWRLFMVICGVPGFICGLSLFKIPESPKYLLSQGQEEKTLEILKNIYFMNTGMPVDTFPVARIIQDIENNTKPRESKNDENANCIVMVLRSMWSQTQPLFSREYIHNTSLICLIQFIIFVTSNGMYMWFPYMLNSVAEFMAENPGSKTYICDVVYSKQLAMLKMEMVNNHSSEYNIKQECTEKLEISTYKHSLTLELLYAVGFALIGFIINKISKRIILFVCLASCGICGAAIIIVDIPLLAIYLYVILLLCGLGISVLSAATVDLYPTHLRAMAVCISLMMGRLGSVVGANIVGALITNHCESAFLSSGISLIICGFLGFFISKNPKDSNFSRRTSLVSMTGN